MISSYLGTASVWLVFSNGFHLFSKFQSQQYGVGLIKFAMLQGLTYTLSKHSFFDSFSFVLNNGIQTCASCIQSLCLTCLILDPISLGFMICLVDRSSVDLLEVYAAVTTHNLVK